MAVPVYADGLVVLAYVDATLAEALRNAPAGAAPAARAVAASAAVSEAALPFR